MPSTIDKLPAGLSAELVGLNDDDLRIWASAFEAERRMGRDQGVARMAAWRELNKARGGKLRFTFLRKGGPRKKPTATQQVHVDQHLAHNPGGGGVHIVHAHDATRAKADDAPKKPKAAKGEPAQGEAVESGGGTSTVWIQEARLGEFQEAVGKLAKKATRLGLTPPSIRPTGQVKTEELKTWTMSGRMIVGGTIQLHEYEVASPAFKMTGWRLHAKAEPRGPKDSMVHVFPGREEVEIPKKYAQGSTHCDHCDAERKRKNLFILKKPGKTGPSAWKQVGGECVKDFTGQDAALLENAMGIAGALNELLKANTDGGDGRASGPRRHSAELVLTLAFAAIANSGGYIRGNEGSSTKNTVAEALHKIHHGQMKVDTGTDDEHLKKAERALAWVRALPRLAPGEFMEKVRVTFADPAGVNPRDLGLAVYAAEAYRRAMGEGAQAQAKAKVPATPYMGNVGDKFGGKQSAADKKAGVNRLPPVEITVTNVSGRPNEFGGTTTMIDFVDDEGHVGRWWAGRNVFSAPVPASADPGTSSEWHYNVPGPGEGHKTGASNYTEEVKEGRRYLIAAGTIKSQDEFRGTKRTTVTRVTLHPIPSDAEVRRHHDSGLTWGTGGEDDAAHHRRVDHLVALHREAMAQAAGKAPPPTTKKLKKGLRVVLRLTRVAA